MRGSTRRRGGEMASGLSARLWTDDDASTNAIASSTEAPAAIGTTDHSVLQAVPVTEMPATSTALAQWLGQPCFFNFRREPCKRDRIQDWKVPAGFHWRCKHLSAAVCDKLLTKARFPTVSLSRRRQSPIISFCLVKATLCWRPMYGPARWAGLGDSVHDNSGKRPTHPNRRQSRAPGLSAPRAVVGRCLAT